MYGLLRDTPSEPSLDDILADPEIQLLMARDGIKEEEVRALIDRTKAQLWSTKPPMRAAA